MSAPKIAPNTLCVGGGEQTCGWQVGEWVLAVQPGNKGCQCDLDALTTDHTPLPLYLDALTNDCPPLPLYIPVLVVASLSSPLMLASCRNTHYRPYAAPCKFGGMKLRPK